MPTALTTAEANAWRDWTLLVDTKRQKNINVSIRRTLLAAAERPDPTDALVDAVIAWENLVGSREGEPTLRVAAAMAWLLGKDGDDRQKIRRQVAKVYGLRSEIVHGNRFLTPQEAATRREEALTITLQALRVLFKDRPELLVECKDSNERSLRLILDEHEPQPSDN
jgi:hypothetical protein